LVAQRRKKFVNKITVRAVYLDDPKTGIARATRRRGKRSDGFANAIARKRLRHWIIFGKRNRARRHDVFPAAFTVRNRAVAFPWPARARFATGVRQLHSRDAALLMNKADDALEHCDVVIAPDAEVLRTDAAFRQDRGRFRQHQSRTADSTAAKMDKMPITRMTIDTRVLTHWRDKDAIGEFQIADRKRIEQMSHTNTIAWHIARGESGAGLAFPLLQRSGCRLHQNK
jgi:hypothetical protein